MPVTYTPRLERLVQTVMVDVNTSLQMAVNRAARETHTLARNTLRNRYALSDRYIDDRLSVSLSVTPTGAAEVSTVRKGTALEQYNASRAAEGISVYVLRSSGRKTIRGSFTGRLRGGGDRQAIFRREGEGRGKLKRLYGPAPFQWMRANLDMLAEYGAQQGQQAMLHGGPL